MRKMFCGLVVVFTAVGLMAGPSASAADPVARVNGGGRADFQETPNAVNTSGFTDFAVSVKVYDDGSASGTFICSIPSIVVIVGDITDGWVNPDGSVTVLGVAHGYDSFIPGPFSGLLIES